MLSGLDRLRAEPLSAAVEVPGGAAMNVDRAGGAVEVVRFRGGAGTHDEGGGEEGEPEQPEDDTSDGVSLGVPAQPDGTKDQGENAEGHDGDHQHQGHWAVG